MAQKIGTPVVYWMTPTRPMAGIVIAHEDGKEVIESSSEYVPASDYDESYLTGIGPWKAVEASEPTAGKYTTLEHSI